MSPPAARRRALSVVVPTYNESANIERLIGRLGEVLCGIDHEIVVVDDESPDLTWQIVERISGRTEGVHLVRRTERRGLASAVVVGMLEASGDCLAVMDGDLQHDETILPEIYRQIVDRGCDICVGSREVAGGSYGDWSAGRRLASRGARRLAFLVAGDRVRDPMSGYFALSREYFRRTVDEIDPRGCKILLEFLARGRDARVAEVGYVFRPRAHGESKLGLRVAFEYLRAVASLRLATPRPSRSIR